MYIVDARVRPPIAMFKETDIYRSTMISRGKRGYGTDPAQTQLSVDLLISQMDEAKIACAVVPGRAENPMLGGGHPESLTELMKAHPGRFVALAGTDALKVKDPVRVAEQAIAAGMKGIVVEPGICDEHTNLDDRRIFPLYDAAQAANLVVYAMGGGSGGPEVSHSNPEHLDRVAINFPKLQIVMVHGGFPYAQAACGVVYRRANVWLMPDLYFPQLPGSHDYLAAANSFAQDRFLFGTSYPFCPFDQHVRRYLELPMPDGIKEKVMGKNAARLFSLQS